MFYRILAAHRCPSSAVLARAGKQFWGPLLLSPLRNGPKPCPKRKLLAGRLSIGFGFFLWTGGI